MTERLDLSDSIRWTDTSLIHSVFYGMYVIFRRMEKQLLFESTRALGITSQLFRTQVDRLLTPLGLTYNQFSLLLHLAHLPSNETGGQSISDIAKAFEIKQPGISKMVNKLEDAHLVTSTADPGDVRRKLISITTQGLQAIGATQQTLGPGVGRWFDGWSNADATTLIGLLNRLNQTIQADKESGR